MKIISIVGTRPQFIKVGAVRGLRLVKPAGCLDMFILEQNAQSIRTGSGGVQKEAYFFSALCRAGGARREG